MASFFETGNVKMGKMGGWGGINPCPICGSGNVRFLFKNYDIMYGYPGWFHLDQCRNCKHIFQRESFTPEMLTDLYSNYYPRSKFDLDQYTSYHDRHDFWSWLDGDDTMCHRHVPPNVRVLDIGCGYCETLGYHKNRGCEVYGVEADDNTQKIAGQYGFHVHNGLFDTAEYEDNFFDYVTMDQVLEHCVDPVATLQKIRRILKPGGTLIISVPNMFSFSRLFFRRYWVCWHTPYHLHLYSQRSLRMVIEGAGLTLDRTMSATSAMYLLANWVLLFVHGKPGQKSMVADYNSKEVYHLDDELESKWYTKLFHFVRWSRMCAVPQRLEDFFGVGSARLYFATKK